MNNPQSIKEDSLTCEGGTSEYPHDLGADRRQRLQRAAEDQVHRTVIHGV